MINYLFPISFGPMGACSPIYGETLLCMTFYVLIMDLMLMSEMVMCIKTSYWQYILPIFYDVPLLGDYVFTLSPPIFHCMFPWIAHLLG
jgi:hypothetical protein